MAVRSPIDIVTDPVKRMANHINSNKSRNDESLFVERIDNVNNIKNANTGSQHSVNMPPTCGPSINRPSRPQLNNTSSYPRPQHSYNNDSLARQPVIIPSAHGRRVQYGKGDSWRPAPAHRALYAPREPSIAIQAISGLERELIASDHRLEQELSRRKSLIGRILSLTRTVVQNTNPHMEQGQMGVSPLRVPRFDHEDPKVNERDRDPRRTALPDSRHVIKHEAATSLGQPSYTTSATSPARLASTSAMQPSGNAKIKDEPELQTTITLHKPATTYKYGTPPRGDTLSFGNSVLGASAKRKAALAFNHDKDVTPSRAKRQATSYCPFIEDETEDEGEEEIKKEKTWNEHPTFARLIFHSPIL